MESCLRGSGQFDSLPACQLVASLRGGHFFCALHMETTLFSVKYMYIIYHNGNIIFPSRAGLSKHTRREGCKFIVLTGQSRNPLDPP